MTINMIQSSIHEKIWIHFQITIQRSIIPEHILLITRISQIAWAIAIIITKILACIYSDKRQRKFQLFQMNIKINWKTKSKFSIIDRDLISFQLRSINNHHKMVLNIGKSLLMIQESIMWTLISLRVRYLNTPSKNMNWVLLIRINPKMITLCLESHLNR